MNTGLIGLCLSSDPAWHLANRHDTQESFRIFHYRSDQFATYYIDGQCYPEQLHSFLESEVEQEHKGSATRILFSQHPATIGFKGTLRYKASIKRFA
jgi:hypothetical protein